MGEARVRLRLRIADDGRGFAVMLKTENLLPKGGCREEVFDPIEPSPGSNKWADASLSVQAGMMAVLAKDCINDSRPQNHGAVSLRVCSPIERETIPDYLEPFR